MASPRPPAAGALPDLYDDRADNRADDRADNRGDDRVIDLRERQGHHPEVVESGSFSRARCPTCGWSGPARRARGVALTDLEQHELLG